ncbi:hypothetical protein V8E36_001334 [Tilletia maclaganii]
MRCLLEAFWLEVVWQTSGKACLQPFSCENRNEPCAKPSSKAAHLGTSGRLLYCRPFQPPGSHPQDLNYDAGRDVSHSSGIWANIAHSRTLARSCARQSRANDPGRGRFVLGTRTARCVRSWLAHDLAQGPGTRGKLTSPS